ncbi:hypothetical protein I7I51_03870 [Histoplasma capsulatum]|uniref:Uncharacterized protein n=1 Tax=Ajellomyces capsulatus TaxID=5037 RepID=A0A8A1MAF5_AJECA|nr:hypothetical protein I7I51_03870 [Histoplasma capsulatum]
MDYPIHPEFSAFIEKPGVFKCALVMAIGDDALSGREEKDIQAHYFPPTQHDRTIHFKGHYLSIYNKETEDYATHEIHNYPTTDYRPFTVPAGYTTYVRGASVYFEV